MENPKVNKAKDIIGQIWELVGNDNQSGDSYLDRATDEMYNYMDSIKKEVKHQDKIVSPNE